jgi:hypothetical protein
MVSNPAANNRGQVWELDEHSRTAKLLYNADLGAYAVAVGSAQALKGGGFSFEVGFINPSMIYARAVETSAAGKIVYVQQTDGAVVRPRLPQCANRMLAMKTRHLDELVEDLLLVASCGSVIALHDRLNAVQGRRSRTKIFIFRRRTAATGRECDY